MKRTAPFILSLILSVAGICPDVSADEDLFREQIAPVLASHCISCHNNLEPKGDFSLEDADSFFEGDFVEPGDSGSSLLVELITSTDGQRPHMPKNGQSLTDDHVKAIKSWIDSGADWPDEFVVRSNSNIDFDWWSLNRLQRPAVPYFRDKSESDWIRTPVDAFVLRKLQENELTPSPAGDRRTLIRRLSYDLTGLPPTIEEIEVFAGDDSPRAYEELVERLLASPRHGEKWARHWLDVVKYADTCGYDKDKLRENAWPYRDYVIRSLNDDKPYRQFVQEQVAGDALFPDSADGILGLGFIAAGPWDFIGHVEVPESKMDGKVARNLDRDDMVSNTLNSFCSLTIQCARCHDHKFDPFTQEHYYGLQAVFAAVDRADRIYDDDPEMESNRNSLAATIDTLASQLGELESQIKSAGGDELEKLNGQIEQARQTGKRPEFGYHSEIAAVPEVEKRVEIVFEEPTKFNRIVLRPCHDDFNNIGAGFGFPVRFRIEVDDRIVFDQTGDDFPNPGLTPVTIPVTATAARVRIVATQLAERRSDFIFALAELQIFDREGNNVALHTTVDAHDSIEMPVRWQAANLVDGIWFETGGEGAAELEQQRNELVEQLVGAELVEQQTQLKDQLETTKSELANLPPGKMVYAASTDFPVQGSYKPTGGVPREVRLLHRGNVDSPGRLLTPGVVPLAGNDTWTMQLDPDASESERRAELARWLVRDENPLTWRSIVNRVWHYHFGRGIVDTPNDLGRMGGQPTHPELLDWLAVELRDSGGSLKDLHRLIVNSSTYRQASIVVSPADVAEALHPEEIDLSNRLLWRMNRRRLSAEEIRDTILQICGQLNLEMGGPGYYLFELEKTEHSPHFEYHKFDHELTDAYRRSIYRFIVRSQPDPYMTTLDCADSSQSTPARNETQTPLQSLTMLNNPFHLVMAGHFATRLRNETTGPAKMRIQHAMQLAVGREPTKDELEIMTDYAAEHGLENLARIIFNLSEFVFVD